MAKVVIHSPSVPVKPKVEEPKVEAQEVDDKVIKPPETDIPNPEVKYPQYTPESTPQEVLPWYYRLAGVMLLVAVCVLGYLLATRSTDLPVNIQEFAVECSEDGSSFVVLLEDTNHSRVDVYKDNVLLELKGDQIKGGIRFDGVDPGIYVVHAITVNNTSIDYGIVQLNLLAASKYSGLTTAVAEAVSSIKDDPQKYEHCTALSDNFDKHANVKDVTDIGALLKSLNAETNNILGFSGEQKLDNEAEWYNLVKPKGVFSSYLETHNMFITTSNYRQVLKAIAEGIREGAK